MQAKVFVMRKRTIVAANKRMTEILSGQDDVPVRSSVLRKVDRAVAHSTEREGCVLLKDYEKGASFDEILKTYQDKTGYECYCNEIYVALEETAGNYSGAVKAFMNRLKQNLVKKYPNKAFCEICSIDLPDGFGGITLEFHTYRENEFYLSKDLEGYTQPILYEIFGSVGKQ